MLFCTSTVMPMEFLYGQLSLTIPSYSIGSSPVDEVDHKFMARDTLLKHLKEYLEATHNRMKQIPDRGQRDVSF